MIKLQSLQITESGLNEKENFVLSPNGNPLLCWTDNGILTTLEAFGSIWPPSTATEHSPSGYVKVGIYGINYLLFFVDENSSLQCVEYNGTDVVFYKSVLVAQSVTLFDVTRNSEEVRVAYTSGGKIYVCGRDNDSRVWNTGTEVVSEPSDITSVSIDYQEEQLVIGYTTSTKVFVYQDPENYVFPTISLSGIPSDAVVRMLEADAFELVYSLSSGNRSIEHVELSSGSYSQDQIVDGTNDNYNLDLFVSEDKTSVVWVEGGYVRYREKALGGWVGLEDSLYVAACDSDSTPKVIYYDDYSRVVYKYNGDIFYAGMTPLSQNINGNFNCSVWGTTKYLDNGCTSVNSPLVTNRLSQRVLFKQQSLSIGGVSCYVKKSQNELGLPFSLIMDVYYSDINGNPYATSLASSTLLSTALPVEGWVEFEFSLDNMLSPIDGYCFVMRQDGGDEDNCASWMAYSDSGVGARISKDGVSWSSITGITRSVRVRGNFNAYERIINDDPSKITHQVITPPAVESIGNQVEYDDLVAGTFVNTKLINVKEPDYYTPPEPVDQEARIYGYAGTTSDWRVTLEDKDLIVSFVVDSSGSSGWNDVFDLRQSIVSSLIEKLKTKTGARILFDFVKFGGVLVDEMEVYLKKKVRGVKVSVDDYVALYGYDEDGNEITEGDPRDHFETGVLAYGFKNLKATTYILYSIGLGWKTKMFTSLESNWHTFWDSSEPQFSIESNGPSDGKTAENSVNFTVSDDTKNNVRYFSAQEKDTIRENLTQNFSIGDYDAYIGDVTGFSEGNRSNIIDPEFINTNFYLSNVDTDTNMMTFSRSSNYDMTTSDAFVESFRSQFMEKGWEDTDVIEFFLVDENDSGAVRFFVQTYSGATIEYEVEPMTSWDLSNVYFLDESAKFEIDAVNSQGENMPDGTMVEFYVNKEPERRQPDEEDPQKSYLFTRDGLTGATVLYLSSTDMSDFSKDKKIDVTDDTKSYEKDPGSGGVFYTYIVEVNLDSNYLVISDPLPEDFLMSEDARVVYPATEKKDNSFKLTSRLNIIANLVDVTPIYTGRKLDPSFFTDLDRIQIDPTEEYDDHNSDPDQVRRNSIEILLTNSYSAVRLLPITEDYFLSQDLKTALSKSMFNLSAREQVELLERQEAMSSSSTESSSSSVVESEEKVYFTPPKDFVMENVTYISDGYASTTMKSYATELEALTFNGNVYLAKEYTVYPVMTFFKANGNALAQMFLPTFDVAFASPATISATVDHMIDFDCVTKGEEPEPFTQWCAGDYATSERELTITYEVDYKDFPLHSGELEIYVYDFRRDVNSANVLDEDLGDVNGCDDDTSGAGGDLIYSAKSPVETVDAYDESVLSMLLADDYFTGTSFSTSQTISITRGVATFTIPVMNRIALLEIHAIYKTSPTSKVVHKQRVYYRSPLRIYYSGPSQILADNNSTYELGANLKWMGTEDVEDGTIVNFSTSGGELKPSVSETVDSFAGGVIFRPFAQVSADDSEETPSYQQTMADRLSGEKEKESRTVYISSSYRGFFAKISTTLEVGSEEAKIGDFYFVCRPSPNVIFADGTDYTIVVGDLQESLNRSFPYIGVVGPDLVNSKMGCLMTGSDLKVETKLAKWSTTTPKEGIFADPEDLPGYAWTKMTSNFFMGRPPFVPPQRDNDGAAPCNGPQCVEISAYTRSNRYNVKGTGIDSYTILSVSTTPSGIEKIPRPRVYLKEPLGIDVSLEPIDRSEYQSVEWRENPRGSHPTSYAIDGYSHPTNRDGESLYYVVAEVTFRDEFIVGTADNPFPTVYFKSGKLEIASSEDDYSYTFTEDDDWPISEGSAIVSISRTTFDEGHFHECYVDESGIGKTTATISYEMGTIVEDHVHQIDLNSSTIVSNVFAEKTVTEEDDLGNITINTFSVNHNHTPRSVAIIQSGPSPDISLSFAVQGIVTYDDGAILSTGLRVDRTLDNYAISNPATESGGGSERTYSEQYFLEITTPEDKVNDTIVPSFKTASSRHENGQLIVFHAWKRTRTGELLPLPDGTRIFTSFKFYEPVEQQQIETDEVLVIDQQKVRDYAILEVYARISGLPVDVSKTKQVLIRSDKYWFPYVSNTVFDEATDDQLYLDSAISTIGEFGGSQIADALIFATNRIIALGSDYYDWLKTFILISDGGESMSEFSHDQATESVNALNGNGECKVFAVKLMDTELFDNVIMQKYASTTDGEFVKVGQIKGTVDDTAESISNSIIGSDKFDLLTGTYSNIVDLGEYKKFKGCRFGVILKSGTQFKFRVRFSDDGINYGQYYQLPSKSYSESVGEQLEWYIVEFDNIPSFGRYMQYETTLKGSISTFESPMFAGNRYEYYEPGRYTMFFQPIEIDNQASYVGEIMFVHEGTIPENSSIRYGITHDENTDFNSFYYSEYQPLFSGGTSSIVLSRFNEKTTTVDYKTYSAVNGGWCDSYDVKVYRCNSSNVRGVLVDSDSYSVDNKKGSITFTTVQPLSDSITFVITMKPYFRVAVDMKNYTSDTIVLDNLTFAYNVVDRTKLADNNDHRDVTSIVKTDLSSFNINSLGTLQNGYEVGNSKVGKDTDILIDMSDFEIRYFLLAHTGISPYVVEMEPNLTVIATHSLTGKTDFVPVSLSRDEENWYFAERIAGGVSIHKFDKTFNFVNSFSSEFDFLESGDTFLNIKRLGSKWYVTESDRVHVLTKSLLHESQILLPFYTDGPFYLTNDRMLFMAQFKDIIWSTDWNGNPKEYYKVFDPQDTNNIVYLDSKFYFITDPKMTRMNMS